MSFPDACCHLPNLRNWACVPRVLSETAGLEEPFKRDLLWLILKEEKW
jgi:hypothetical protein